MQPEPPVQDYSPEYDPRLLRPLQRPCLWREDGLRDSPFQHSHDVWMAWELSWLNRSGLPRNAVAELRFPGDSPRLIESKSLKLYLFSLNQKRFSDPQELRDTVMQDLAEPVGAAVDMTLWPAADIPRAAPLGQCLDDQDIDMEQPCAYDPGLLAVHDRKPLVEEALHSHLLRSLCPLTGQPDWACVQIGYQGRPIQHAALLRYIVSWRSHKGFAEYCTERIFLDILSHCAPRKLRVSCHYLRRGGLDITPVRGTHPEADIPRSLARQ